MTPEEMAQVRPRLVAFAAEMLGELPRSDQRAKGELYLRGLMLGGKRKSMQPMAARLGVDHQQLQQFVTTSTWDHVEVRRRLAGWAGEHAGGAPNGGIRRLPGLHHGRGGLPGRARRGPGRCDRPGQPLRRSCVDCLTVAFARQLVLSAPATLGGAARNEIMAL